LNTNNKIIWITGASSGIGRALAIELSKFNTSLILSSRNIDELNKTAEICKKNGANCFILSLDLSNPDNIKSAFDIVQKKFNKIDILINNGGISQRSLAEDTSIKVDEQIIKINYLGTVALTKALLPHFIERRAGRFVVVTSVTGKIGTPLRSTYAASKHALHGFFDSLRAEVYKYNIKVTLICPGFVQTNVSKNALTGTGKPQNIMDKAIQNGVTPAYLA